MENNLDLNADGQNIDLSNADGFSNFSFRDWFRKRTQGGIKSPSGTTYPTAMPPEAPTNNPSELKPTKLLPVFTSVGGVFNQNDPCPIIDIQKNGRIYRLANLFPSKSGKGYTVQYIATTPTPQDVEFQLNFQISDGIYRKWSNCRKNA